MKLSKINYIEIVVILLLIVGWYFYYKKYFKEPIDNTIKDKSDDFLMLMPMITTALVIVYILSNRTPLSENKIIENEILF